MRGVRQAGIGIILLIIIVVLVGCAETTCPPEKSYEKKPLIKTVELYSEESYTEEETRLVGENCIERHYSEMNSSRFNISLGEKEWIDKPPVLGETNYIRRVVNIYNALEEIDAIYLDKIYLYNGTETKRSKHPMMFLVEPRSSKTLYVMWNTQYDPLKDVAVDFTNNTEEAGFVTKVIKICHNETETVNVTKHKEVLSGTEDEIEGYEDVVKVKLKRKC